MCLYVFVCVHDDVLCMREGSCTPAGPHLLTLLMHHKFLYVVYIHYYLFNSLDSFITLSLLKYLLYSLQTLLSFSWCVLQLFSSILKNSSSDSLRNWNIMLMFPLIYLSSTVGWSVAVAAVVSASWFPCFRNSYYCLILDPLQQAYIPCGTPLVCCI